MGRLFAVLVVAGTLAVAPGAAVADFPEQPGDNVATGCANLFNQGTVTAFAGNPQHAARASDTAIGIVGPLAFDVCYGG